MIGLKIYYGSASQEPTVWGQPLRHRFSGTIFRHKNPERMRSENIGNLIFLTFPNLRKSNEISITMYFSPLGAKIESKYNINLSFFVELSFGITL